MFRNYLIVAVRNLLRHKLHAGISVLGLSVGIVCCILIFLHVQSEMGYNSGLTNADRLCRIVRQTQDDSGNWQGSTYTSGALGPALRQDLPEVGRSLTAWGWDAWVTYGGKTLHQSACLAEPHVLDVFEFPMVKGDRATALEEPYSLVITESTAHRFFGDEDPLGKTIQLDHLVYGGDYRVSGVIQDPPDRTTIGFDVLTATITSDRFTSLWTRWHNLQGWRPWTTYLVLAPGATPKGVERKLPGLVEQYMGEEVRQKMVYRVQPVTRIHLHSFPDYGVEPWQGNIRTVQVMVAVGWLILLIACVNAMNLATARASLRAREVGVRKALGAGRRALLIQLLEESGILSFLSLLLALGLSQFVIPEFNAAMGTRVALDAGANPALWVSLLGIGLAVTLLSGGYPALMLSGAQPASVIHSVDALRSGRDWLRNGLVVFQFAVSVFLVVATSIVLDQLNFMQKRDIGYNAESLLSLQLFKYDRHEKAVPEDRLSMRYNTIKREFLRHPNVVKASAYREDVMGLRGTRFFREVKPEGREEETLRVPILEVDEDFFDTFEMDLALGRNFDVGIVSDTTSAIIVNQRFVERAGWDEPLGRWVEYGERKRHVIGVVKDFHIKSMHQPLTPFGIIMRKQMFGGLALRVKGEVTEELETFLKKAWDQFLPHRPFGFNRMDRWIQGVYYEERQLGRMLRAFAGLAIILACLGLFGLSSHLVQRRRREMGIRKALGATASSIGLLLSSLFTRLVLAAILIAWPVAYWVMRNWLDGFAYQVGLGPWVFLWGGMTAMGIALATVSYHAARAATANPVDALRHE